MVVITGFVPGKPKAQGSVSPIPYRKKTGRLGVSVFQNKDLLHWRDLIAANVTEQTGGEILFQKGTPVAVTLIFHVVKPKSFKGNYPVTRSSSDLDKLARAANDAFDQANVYDDDSQIVSLHVYKIFVETEEEQGMKYLITKLG
jgi:Holliday junction resolvase RusA-like endonuclease